MVIHASKSFAFLFSLNILISISSGIILNINSPLFFRLNATEFYHILYSRLSRDNSQSSYISLLNSIACNFFTIVIYFKLLTSVYHILSASFGGSFLEAAAWFSGLASWYWANSICCLRSISTLVNSSSFLSLNIRILEKPLDLSWLIQKSIASYVNRLDSSVYMFMFLVSDTTKKRISWDIYI